jgi:predicted RNase H-like nuclease (RuvC/YqgF family)
LNLTNESKLEETASSSQCSNVSSVELYEDDSDLGSDRLMRRASRMTWTERDITTTFKAMQEHQRTLKTEHEISIVKQELKKIISAGEHLRSLGKAVLSMEKQIAKFQQEKLERAYEISKLRREVEQLKSEETKRLSRLFSETENSKSTRISNFIARLKSYSGHHEKENTPQIHDYFSSRSRSASVYSVDRQRLLSVTSCPPVWKSYWEREAKSLQRKITFLNTQNKGNENEVQKLQNWVAQLSKTLEILLIGMGQKVNNSNDRARLEELKNNLSRGQCPSLTGILLDKKKNDKCVEKSQEEIAQGSKSDPLFSSQRRSRRSYDFKTFAALQRAKLETGPISFVL